MNKKYIIRLVERITLVCDNLNTHTKEALYEAFPPEKAREYVRRINFVYTPKQGSWLSGAECDSSCSTSQRLADRRIGDLATPAHSASGRCGVRSCFRSPKISMLTRPADRGINSAYGGCHERETRR